MLQDTTDDKQEGNFFVVFESWRGIGTSDYRDAFPAAGGAPAQRAPAARLGPRRELPQRAGLRAQWRLRRRRLPVRRRMDRQQLHAGGGQLFEKKA